MATLVSQPTLARSERAVAPMPQEFYAPAGSESLCLDNALNLVHARDLEVAVFVLLIAAGKVWEE